MSFRVKPSHKFLNTSGQPTPTKKPVKSIDELLREENEQNSSKTFDWISGGGSSAGSTSQAQYSNTQDQYAHMSKNGLSQGLVITQNYRAQEDFM